MLTATVAGRTWELHGCDTMHHADKLLRFPPVSDTADARFRYEREVPFCCPSGEPLSSTPVTRTFAQGDGRYTVYRADHKLSMVYDAHYTDVTVRVSPQTKNERERQYLTALQVFSYSLLSQGGSLLHSAGLAFADDGVALAGRAQVGKSTMARHLKARVPSVEILCEDAPAVLKREGGFWLCGTPFCGDDEACANREVPLRGIVILQQGTANRVSVLSPREALYHLLGLVPRPPFDAATATLAVTAVTEWVSELPILVYENDGSARAGEILSEALIENGWIAERTDG